MAVLTVQTINTTGVAPTNNAAAGGGDSFVNDGKTFIHVTNGSAGSLNVIITAQNACSQGVLHTLTVAVPAGESRMIGPFNRNIYNDAAGKVQLTYSGVTSLTIAVLSNPDA
ncbi:MAG: hypothetical protein ACYC6A_00785 [Armatimonadota bacterium]